MSVNKLDADFLKRNSQSQWGDIHVFESIDSTSTWVKSQPHSRLVCLAEHQTAGRGRHGHQWQSPNSENIYLSFNWQFDSQPAHLSLLSLWVGILVAETLAGAGLSGHGVKWPNDIYWQKQKMGGILLETSNLSSMIVVGIGLNINMFNDSDIDQPWASLGQALGHEINRNHILLSLLDKLYKGLEEFAALSVNDIKEQWQQWDLINGRQVTFQESEKARAGDAIGVDDSGQLLVRFESGEVKAFGTTISKVRW
ncbi:biotin--[acetyl-CoA-carboxylase] ligase [Leucothrix sargassi]|nr:biotin--[acetyl-CoA-carboxylase] ligase [Leucothrix sargassi]